MESQRLKKVASVLQRDLIEILQGIVSSGKNQTLVVSVTRVRVSADLSIAKVYVSVFPFDQARVLIDEINELSSAIKHKVAQRTRHQFRRMPELRFFVDDSFEYIEMINRSLNDDENPIKNPALLQRRKKK